MLESMMCCVSSIGRREKGLKGGETEGEESGGSEEVVILLDLCEVGESCQNVLKLSDCNPPLSTLSRKSRSPSEMKEWEGDRMKGLTPECDLLDYVVILGYSLSVWSSCLIQ